jgi:RNA polymerase sigma-70 factor (ECF subfamily)
MIQMADEENLLQRARTFDQGALAEIYDAYSPRLYRYAWRLLGDTALAEDCVADTFARLLRALSGGGGPSTHLQAYLYRTAHNWVTDYYRQRQPASELRDTYADPGASPGEAAEQNLRRRALRQALARLTPSQRQVVALKYLEGWTNEEAARALGKPLTAVKSLQHRALAALHRLLEEEEA